MLREGPEAISVSVRGIPHNSRPRATVGTVVARETTLIFHCSTKPLDAYQLFLASLNAYGRPKWTKRAFSNINK